MLLNILHTITDFAVLVPRLITEELADEQRMVLVDQFVQLQGLDAAVEFDLHDLLMILITILIIREDAAEFMRCLNEICKEGDARYRQVATSYYYGEIAERGVGPVLKEMALIAMHLASLNPVTEEVENDSEIVYALREESKPRSLFDWEVAAVKRMIRGRRKSAGMVYDEWAEWLNDLEANGATLDELDDAFAHVEALDQYDEDGAIVRMSAHERTVACGRVDHEFTADDLPEQARFLAGDMLRAYASGVEIEEIRNEVNAHLDVLFPVKGRTAEGARFFSRANLELQRLTRDALEEILEDCFGNYHLTAMRNNRSYRRFYIRVRRATDTSAIGALMKQAYEARQNSELSVKHFVTLNTAADNQRERLLSAPISAFREFLELPRLRKVLSIVRNKRRASARKPSLAPKPAVPMRGAAAMKRGAVAKPRAEAMAGRQQ